MLAANGPDVIYAGDHLYGDVIKCRKHCEWRTLLIVPELSHELEVSQNSSELISHISRLESIVTNNQDVCQSKIQLQQAVNDLNQRFSKTGSLFRSGSRLTYFGSQMMGWADIYTGSVNTLAGYDLDHKFVAAPIKLAHETGVEVTTSGENSPVKKYNISLAASFVFLGVISFFLF